mgnify:CR=1 FL=1
MSLPPTPGDRHGEILAALGRLDAGGSTNGGQGIDLAYAMARQAYIKDGVNRVVMATDGDFNVGVYDQRALETKVEQGREAGVALMVNISDKVSTFDVTHRVAMDHPDIWATVGTHPHEAKENPGLTAVDLIRLAERPKVVEIVSKGLTDPARGCKL